MRAKCSADSASSSEAVCGPQAMIEPKREARATASS